MPYSYPVLRLCLEDNVYNQGKVLTCSLQHQDLALGTDEYSETADRSKPGLLAHQFCIDHIKCDVGISTVLASESAKRALIVIVGWVPEGEMMLLWGCSHYLGVITDVFSEFLPHLKDTVRCHPLTS